MRIALAHAFYRVPGGEDGYVRRQADLLAREHDVFLMGRENADVTGGVRDAKAMLYSRRRKVEVVAQLRDWGADVIHMHNPYPAFGPALHLAARELATPLVMTVHNMRLRCPNGYMFTEGAVCRRCARGNYGQAVVHKCFPSRKQAGAYAATLWAHRVLLDLERFVTMFLAPSEFMYRRLLDWGIPVERTRMVRNFAEEQPSADATPGEFVTFLGRLSSEKGIDVLLSALARAGDPPCRIIGGGPLEAEVRALASDLGLRRTEFLGWVPSSKTPRLLREARVVVVPSLSEETASLSGMEALASARPILVSDLGALPELAAAGRGGTFRPGDAEGLAALIDLYTRDDARCESAGKAGLQFAATELSSAKHLRGLLGAYEDAVAA